ncbi:unnamed protein product, partial [Rotaria sordida]
HARANELKERTGSDEAVTTNPTSNSRLLSIPDESTLSRLVAARLDLPISRRLLGQNFKLSIIKRCWKDQLRIKGELIKVALEKSIFQQKLGFEIYICTDNSCNGL